MRHFPSPKALILATLALAGVAAVSPAGAGPSIVVDAASGRVVSHEDAFQPWYPASLTKLMTAYVAFRAVKAGELALDSPIRISKKAAGEPPSKMGYKAGSVVTLDNALKMLLIKSANDIAMAVGENIGGSEKAFVARMNAEAVRLGMRDTRFANPNGLHDPAQHTTARDLALLVMAIRNQFPEHAHYFGIEGLVAGKTVMKTFNLLVGRYEGADGMKTGFICASGFNLIASATRGNRTLVAVVLGEASGLSRADTAARLLDQAFAAPSAGGEPIGTLERYGGGAAIDMRETVCAKKKPAKEQSEAAAEHEAAAEKSPWLEPLDHEPRYVAVGLGGATGPVPAAMADADGKEYADVPIPEWRPDMPPPVIGQAATGDGSG